MSIPLILVGVATWYAGPYVGQPLYCNGPTHGNLMYDSSTEPWLAMDPYYYEMGWECGDEVWVHIGGEVLKLRLYDTGPLLDYYIMDFGPDVPIVANLPEHLWPLRTRSALVRVVNHTKAEQEFIRRGVLGGVREEGDHAKTIP